ncbi:MAG: DUF523 domain-containing protein [Acholeplasmatales bacterium]|nr:DUF523 domain-containing protein [Acholeplasmatales bacterium]
MEKILISACLLGENCKYNGKNNYIDIIEKLKQKYILYPICPEVFGGLSIPRSPSEINGNKVISKEGIDVTSNFLLGANKSLDIALENDIKIAILKDGSPSCGVNYIYDGTFSKTKIKGFGITTKLLSENKIKIYSENEIQELLK